MFLRGSSVDANSACVEDEELDTFPIVKVS